MKHVFLLVLMALLSWPGVVQAQKSDAPVGWLRASLDAPLRGRWSWYSEVETRQRNAQLGGQQLGRLGLRLHVSPCLSLTAGYVFAANDGVASAGPALPEHRLYQEVTLADATGPLRASHRLRTEERWLRTSPETAYRFAPRLRYQLRLVAPLHAGGALPVGAWYVVAANEFFASLGRQENRSFLEENRVSGGLGHRLSPRTAVELAYLYQTQAGEQSAGQALARNAVQVSVAMTAPTYRALVQK